MKVIFLDMDGVLVIGHQVDVTYDWEAVRRLYDLQRKTNAQIVLSSDWRYSWKLKDLIKSIESQTGFDLDIIDATPQALKNESGIYVARKRGDEISYWISQNDVENYTILDDLPENQFNDGQIKHLVNTDYNEGFTSAKYQEALSILG